MGRGFMAGIFTYMGRMSQSKGEEKVISTFFSPQRHRDTAN
jgi:hypothetical protein